MRVGGQHGGMTRRDHALRFAVGTMLLTLGCAGGDKAKSSTQPPKDRKHDENVCEPPDCHINPGPNEMPKEPEPPPPDEPAAPS